MITFTCVDVNYLVNKEIGDHQEKTPMCLIREKSRARPAVGWKPGYHYVTLTPPLDLFANVVTWGVSTYNTKNIYIFMNIYIFTFRVSLSFSRFMKIHVVPNSEIRSNIVLIHMSRSIFSLQNKVKTYSWNQKRENRSKQVVYIYIYI